ncbi:PREDICTED: probable E3 ubiquitin-protein ligase DTX3 [Branchiostoma belcheri]|uniref:E3 ubiquitin-protein ligase n=1 Tax=Branchiostoma belcheri TaxID=7741 RepID=A0A6P4ZUB7_BRABE|nr:PREDICTED: probable E3 ubiquitin-protein ligase DTX3 [Branchiostoma belcheri]
METKSCCPVCSAVIGKLTGNQPEGKMKVSYNNKMTLCGYKHTEVIVIDYVFKDGTQGPQHPNPGKPYKGTCRTAYLPRNTDGEKVLSLLKQAFNQRLTFTIGTSATTGQSDKVVWNDIHHKTRTYGGPSMHGYPDPGYLKRVTEDLAAKGIK